MINQKIIDSYKEIKAPEELKKRVLEAKQSQASKNKFASIRNLALVAACFVVVYCLFMFGMFNDQVKVEVDTLPMFVSSVRGGDPIVSYVTITFDGEIEIEVFDESFYIADNDKVIVSKLNKQYASEDKIILGWTGEDGKSVIKINGVEYEIVRSDHEIKVNKK